MTLEAVVGSLIADDLAPSQVALVERAITQNEAGVRRIAQYATQNSTIRKPALYLLDRIKHDKHLADPDADRSKASNISLLDFAERRYVAKIRAFDQHNAWDQGWTIDDAVAYAVDYTIIDLKRGNTDELEDALRDRLGLPPIKRRTGPPVTPPTWSDVLKTIAAGKQQPRPASRTLDADELLEELS